MSSIIALFTSWSSQTLIYGLLCLLGLLLIQEFIFMLLIKKSKRKNPEIPGILSLITFLKILRIFMRFAFLYVFLKVIELPGGPVYPWNLLYELASMLILFAGLLTAVQMYMKRTLRSYDEREEENILQKNLLSLSNKSLIITLYFLSFSVILWKTLNLIPEELRNRELLKLGLLFNGIVISGIVLIVIHKTVKSALNILDGKMEAHRISIIIKSLSLPLKLITIAGIMIWFKNMKLEMPTFNKVIDKSILLFFLWALIIFVYQIIEILGTRLSHYSKNDTNNLDKTFIEMVRMISRFVIILVGIFGTVQILTGKPLNALLAGLGIGGLAVALAAQDTLKNFFGSIMIMTDKPFKIGERVTVGNYDGTIEAIGFRSTRIRTLVGHQVIIPNDQMASSSIENIGRRPHIRRLTNITVTYGTTPEKMERALEIIKAILDNHEGMPEDLPPRVYFNEFNADSLNIIMIFWYSPPDYWNFMDFSQMVNLKIMKEFAAEGIEFAFPTSTTYLEQADGQSIKLELEQKEKDTSQ